MLNFNRSNFFKMNKVLTCKDLINVLIHELLHVIYYQYNLSNSSSEEDVVNSMANGLTELLTRTALLETIKKLKR